MMATIQFSIPTRVAAVVDVMAIQRKARESGVEHFWLELNTHHAGVGKTRLTCQREHAILLVGELVPMAEKAQRSGDTDMLLAVAEAARVALELMDKEIRSPTACSPVGGIGRNSMQGTVTAKFDGFFNLADAKDLREKLRRDFERLEKTPTSTDAAFNFFVTADTMLDWRHRDANGETDTTKVTGERSASPLLQTVNHIASGAKHFAATQARHKSVSALNRETGVLTPFAYEMDALTIHLENDAAKLLGSTISSVELARRVIAYWDGELL